ncbi:hypothetical protein CPB84DRAFT_1873641, partial [Gymnopilus junonius]
NVQEGTLGPVVIWVSVYPGSTSAETAHQVSQDILRLLADRDVYGVDVEWSEGVTSRMAAPALLSIVGKPDATSYARRHLTTALSIPIAAAEKAVKDGQGTAGFYFHENNDKDGNPATRADSSLRQKVWACGSRCFQQGLDEITAEVDSHRIEASTCAKRIATLKAKKASGQDERNAKRLKDALRELEKHEEAIVELEKLYKEIDASWNNVAHRDIGVLEYSHPISATPSGNLSATEFKRFAHPRIDSIPVIKFPSDGLLRIKGCVTKEQLANPELLDINGYPCLVVLKDGCASDLTFGRYAGLESFVCDENGVRSVELAFYNYDEQSRPFSSKGDSGSLIVNGKGEMVGLLRSGMSRALTGSMSTYVTYATPAWRLREWIMEIYPNADFTRKTW